MKTKTYWIDECIVSPEGKLLPRGFELHIGETARIVVPSDVSGDKESLYEEEIQLSQKTFAATYEDENPVHIEDGETIGKEVTKMTGEVYKVITVNGKQVKCIDEIDGFSLEIDGQRYHVYVDADGNTNVDHVMGDEREYLGMINDLWTGDEEEAARFILS